MTSRDYLNNKFDVIVVGAGHAGCEAALSAARLGCNVLLCTLNVDNIALQPCNPAIGGPAKSTLVREIDALGGVMGEVADATYIQMKTLNSSKGPAVRALRAQSDKKEYTQYMRHILESTDNIWIKQTCITDLKVVDKKIVGAVDEYGIEYSCRAIILTTGTSLEGKMYVGLQAYSGGRLGERAAIGLSASLREHGIITKKLKTGTPARVDKRTIDYSKMSVQPGDEKLSFYSFKPNRPVRQQYPCYLTRTNEETHAIIRANLDKSPMYQGLIQGVGPRYCPSIEDKVVRFKDKERHQIFYEPESLDLDQEYIQGFSTSMPVEVQDKMLRLLPGLKDCEVIRYAYAIEYDAIDPLELWPSLETKLVKNLFTAGQINGTSGYEEAAAQGLIAGINAALKVSNREPLVLRRDEAYIGVMIDDLVTKGTKEPYRLLTSRAEYRLLLRHDNADLRLREKGYQVGLIKKEQYNRLNLKKEAIASLKNELKFIKIKPQNANPILERVNSMPICESTSLESLIKRPEINYHTIKELALSQDIIITSCYDKIDEVLEQVEIDIKYEGYINKSLEQAQRMKNYELKNIPDNINYDLIDNIALEAREKLKKIQPKTIGQASRISGVNPADISVLMVYIERMVRG